MRSKHVMSDHDVAGLQDRPQAALDRSLQILEGNWSAATLEGWNHLKILGILRVQLRDDGHGPELFRQRIGLAPGEDEGCKAGCCEELYVFSDHPLHSP